MAHSVVELAETLGYSTATVRVRQQAVCISTIQQRGITRFHGNSDMGRGGEEREREGEWVEGDGMRLSGSS